MRPEMMKKFFKDTKYFSHLRPSVKLNFLVSFYFNGYTMELTVSVYQMLDSFSIFLLIQSSFAGVSFDDFLEFRAVFLYNFMLLFYAFVGFEHFEVCRNLHN